jgi:hypothetical protein
VTRSKVVKVPTTKANTDDTADADASAGVSRKAFEGHQLIK